MKPKILYIENKADGTAWIGWAEFSKSGQTVYFNNHAFKKLKNTGIRGNHFDIETGEEYWISGVKKNGQDRHPFEGGKILLDRKAIDAYLELVDFNVLDENKFTIVDISETEKSRFNEMENAEVPFANESREAWHWDNNRKKLV